MSRQQKRIAALRARAEGQFTTPLTEQPPFPPEWGEARSISYLVVAQDGRETRHRVPPPEGPFLPVYGFDGEERAFEATATFPQWDDQLDQAVATEPLGAGWMWVGAVHVATTFRHRPWVGDRFPSWERGQLAGSVTLWRRPYSPDRHASGSETID
jgi:hypothetical protein